MVWNIFAGNQNESYTVLNSFEIPVKFRVNGISIPNAYPIAIILNELCDY